MCKPDELIDPSCPVHGLYGEVKYPPMDRHAKIVYSDHVPGLQVGRETAAQVQRRLYLEVAADRVRIEAAGYRYPLRACPPRIPSGQR